MYVLYSCSGSHRRRLLTRNIGCKILAPDYVLTVILQLIHQRTLEIAARDVLQHCLDVDFRHLFRDLAEGNKNSAARNMVFFVCVGYEHLVGFDEPAVSVNASSIGEVENILSFSWRIRRVIAVVCHYSNDIVFSIFKHI